MIFSTAGVLQGHCTPLEVMWAFPSGFWKKENRPAFPDSASEHDLLLKPCLALYLHVSLCTVLFPPPRIKSTHNIRAFWLDTNSSFYVPDRLRASLASVRGACCRNTMKSNFAGNTSSSKHFWFSKLSPELWQRSGESMPASMPPGESALGKAAANSSYELWVPKPAMQSWQLFCHVTD